MVTAYSFAWNFTDLIWLKRWNIMLGVSDKLFILTEEVLAPILVKELLKNAVARDGCVVASYHVTTDSSFATNSVVCLLAGQVFVYAYVHHCCCFSARRC